MLLLRYYKKDFEVQGIALLFNTSTTKPKDAIFRYKNHYLYDPDYSVFSAKYNWQLLAGGKRNNCSLPRKAKGLKNSNFFLQNAKFSYQRQGLRPALLIWGVNTCNLAKLGQKRTIFKRLFNK